MVTDELCDVFLVEGEREDGWVYDVGFNTRKEELRGDIWVKRGTD